MEHGHEKNVESTSLNNTENKGGKKERWQNQSIPESIIHSRNNNNNNTPRPDTGKTLEYSYFEKGCRKKCTRQSCVGDFKCTVFQRNLKESYGRPLIYVCEC